MVCLVGLICSCGLCLGCFTMVGVGYLDTWFGLAVVYLMFDLGCLVLFV